MSDPSLPPSDPPPEPEAAPGRRPHRERVKAINDMMMEGQVAGVCIDDEPEYRAWYLHELTKYPTLEVVEQMPLVDGVCLIKVRKGPRRN